MAAPLWEVCRLRFFELDLHKEEEVNAYLTLQKGEYNVTQHLVFRLSHFNAAIFLADNFCKLPK